MIHCMQPRMSAAAQSVASTIFAVLALTDWTGRDPWVAAFEKRAAASFPELPRTMGEAETWLDRFGTFFSDHFGLRRAMIDLQGRIQISLLHRSPSPQVRGKRFTLSRCTAPLSSSRRSPCRARRAPRRRRGGRRAIR